MSGIKSNGAQTLAFLSGLDQSKIITVEETYSGEVKQADIPTVRQWVMAISDLVQGATFEMHKIEDASTREVIASYCLCNTASLNVYEISEDEALVGINGDEPEKCPITYVYTDEYSEDNKACLLYHGTYFPLDEFIRVGGGKI